MHFELALTSCRTARLCSVPRFAGTGADRLVRRARRCGALAIGCLHSRKHGKTVAPAEATLAMRHAVFSATLSIVGRAQSVPEASVCGRKKATGTMARFGFVLMLTTWSLRRRLALFRWCTGRDLGASLQSAIFGALSRWSNHRQLSLRQSGWL